MRILALIHHEVAGTGVFADEVGRRGHELEEWLPSAGPLPRPLGEYGAVVAFGGGMQADEEELYPWLRVARELLSEAVERELPALGVCLGAQVLARATGGAVGPAREPECGWQPVALTDAGAADPLFTGRPARFDVFQWHSYAFDVPARAVLLASSEVCPQSFRVGACAWGVQWHPEVTADSIALWAREHVPAPGGVPVAVDLPALEATITERIGSTNDEGRELCGRFLAVAEERRR